MKRFSLMTVMSFLVIVMLNGSNIAQCLINRFNQNLSISQQEKLYLHLDKPYYSVGENIWFSAYVVNAASHRLTSLSHFVYVELINQSDSVLTRVKIRRDSVGFNGYIPLQITLPEGTYLLRAYTSWMQNASVDFFYRRYISIVNKINDNIRRNLSDNTLSICQDFDVQFLPESGWLLPDSLQTVGFKIVGENGLSVDASGTVFNSSGDDICTFSTFHNGMGKFAFQPIRGESYYAIVKTSASKEKRVVLPTLKSDGIGLSMVYSRKFVWYDVRNFSKTPTNALCLLIHSRGRLLTVLPIKEPTGCIAEADLPEGIVSFSVVDSLYNTYCERLYFVRPLSKPVVEMTSDKLSYGKREYVNIKFEIHDNVGNPFKGRFSLSVTDNYAVKDDGLSGNILSNLLLSSDLKGYIESTGSYFSERPALDRERLDVLMLTQGWSRFNTPEVVKGIFKPNDYYMEVGQSFGGEVRNISKKAVPGNFLEIIADSLREMKVVITDSIGRFYVEGFEFPDSTTFRIKSRKESFPSVTIIPDTDQFPSVREFIQGYIGMNDKMQIPEKYSQLCQDRYFTENGVRTLNLKEVTVNAKKLTQAEKDNPAFSVLADKKITSERLFELSGLSILDIIQMEPGIFIQNDSIFFLSAGFTHNGTNFFRPPPLFLVNDVEWSLNDILALESSEVDEIMFFKGVHKENLWGARAKGGVVYISLKKSSGSEIKIPASQVIYLPMGYQKPVDFYVPRYDVDSVLLNNRSDLRTTIFWEPELQTDSNGAIQVQFYTADPESDYTVNLEGIGDKGIVTYHGALLRKNK